MPEQPDGGPLPVHILSFFQRQIDQRANDLGGNQLLTRFDAAGDVEIRRLGNNLLELRGNLQDKFKVLSP